jgi:hypothetical protein
VKDMWLTGFNAPDPAHPLHRQADARPRALAGDRARQPRVPRQARPASSWTTSARSASASRSSDLGAPTQRSQALSRSGVARRGAEASPRSRSRRRPRDALVQEESPRERRSTRAMRVRSIAWRTSPRSVSRPSAPTPWRGSRAAVAFVHTRASVSVGRATVYLGGNMPRLARLQSGGDEPGGFRQARDHAERFAGDSRQDDPGDAAGAAEMDIRARPDATPVAEMAALAMEVTVRPARDG